MRLIDDTRARLYDAAIVGLTRSWYGAVLERLPRGCRLLDVGIGTGGALLANASALREKDLRVVGVDIDAAYVARCRRAVSRAGLAERIETRLESIDEHRGGPYEAAYFSASFMLLPDPPGSLRHVRTLLAPGSSVYFTQTFEHQRAPVTELVKPLLRRVTTIDFGRVTYENDFLRTLAEGGAEVTDTQPIGSGQRRSARLIVARYVDPPA